MFISRHPCLEINESFLLCKKLSDKCENEYFIGGVRASLFFYASLPNFTTEFYFVKLDNLFFVYNMTVHPCTVYFFRHPCLEINESFLQSKKLSDKCVCKIFIGGICASYFFCCLPYFFYRTKFFVYEIKIAVV